jgi:cardiolipin synthase
MNEGVQRAALPHGAAAWADRAAPPSRRPPPVPAAHAQAHALVRSLGEPLMGGNRVELLLDGPDTYRSMFEAIGTARDHINIESYIVEADGPGEELARRLEERCRAGVRVNLLFDGYGSLLTRGGYFERLRRAGVSLCEYNPPGRVSSLLSRALHLRDHRKLMVVDGRVGFIGGVNISSVYASGPLPAGQDGPEGGRPGWRDTHVRVEGPIVAQLQRLFIGHWQRSSTGPMPKASYFPPLPACGRHRVGLAATEAGHRRNPFYRALLGAVGAAQHRILLTTAYLVPPRRLLRALEHAALRGVQVELLVPGASDFRAALHAGRAHYERLLRAGVRIHERHDTMLHAKTCVIDGVWASVGSSNLDWRSVLHNAEANLVMLDEDIGRRLERVFRDDVACAREIDAARWQRRGWAQRGKELLALRLQYFI